MTRVNQRAVLAALWAATVLGAADAAEDTYDIRGFVVDEQDLPVAGATVSLEGTEIATQTDSLGGFELLEVPSGEHRVTARLGCVMAGHIDGMRVPRPLRVPLPIRLDRVDCGAETTLDDADQSALIARTVNAFTNAEQRIIAGALLGDGAVRILNGGNVTIHETRIGDVHVPIAHLAADAEFPEAIWLSVCITSRDERRALVRIVRASPPVPEELDLFVGDAGLLSFERDAVGAPWTIARQLVCVDTDPRDSVGGAVRTTTD